MLFALLCLFTVLAGFVSAHPTQEASAKTGSAVQTRDCSAHISAFNEARRRKRSPGKRTIYPGIQNSTCVTSPEVLAADNWVANAPVRTDLTEGQGGVPLVLDIGVLDVTTCKAMPSALVEVWSANAVGQYGSSFLRGGTPTNAAGIAELNTIFPGFIQGSASHVGVRVHPKFAGGSTVTSNAAAHIGRIFFTDKWSTVIGGSAPYNTNSVKQTPNAQDSTFLQASSQGFNPVADIEEIHDDWPEGVVGYITVGVNPHALFTAT